MSIQSQTKGWTVDGSWMLVQSTTICMKPIYKPGNLFIYIYIYIHTHKHTIMEWKVFFFFLVKKKSSKPLFELGLCQNPIINQGPTCLQQLIKSSQSTQFTVSLDPCTVVLPMSMSDTTPLVGSISLDPHLLLKLEYHGEYQSMGNFYRRFNKVVY